MSGGIAGDTATVADVVDVRSWGLTVVAGAGGLHRRVTWAHVFDVPDPSAWIDGGELVIMTGTHMPSDAADQIEFIRRLHKGNASALAIGTRGPALDREALATADVLAFPLIRVPAETGYLPIVKFVAAANGGNVQRGLTNSVRIYETLAPAQEVLDSVARFRHIEKIAGYRLSIVSRTGRSLFDGLDDVDPGTMEHVRATCSEEGHWPSLAIPEGFACPVRIGNRVAGFLVARETEARTPSGLSAFRTIETVARLEIGSLYRDRETRRRRGAELFGRYLHGVVAPSRLPGPQQDVIRGSVAIAAIQLVATAPVDLEIDVEVHHRLADERVRHLLVVEGGRTLVALHSKSLPTLVQIADELPVTVGLSAQRASLVDAAVALREALWALEYGKPGSGRHVREFSVDDPEWTQWLPSDPGALAQLVERTLGPVIAYDRERQADLVLSLRAYFDTDGRLQATADRLHIHKHTLSYRLKRIETLTGKSMSSAGDRAQFWLALSAHAIVESRP